MNCIKSFEFILNLTAVSDSMHKNMLYFINISMNISIKKTMGIKYFYTIFIIQKFQIIKKNWNRVIYFIRNAFTNGII